MSKNIIKFTNCRLLRHHQIMVDDLWVRNGIVINPESLFFDEKIQCDETVDMMGALIAPGLIDIQINGGFGVDFSHQIESVENGLLKVASGVLSHGVTAFCPTIVTSKPEVYKKVLPQLKLKNKYPNFVGAEILGAHVEGPFINKEKKGAHVEENILDFYNGEETLSDVYGCLDNIKIVTLAPEKAKSGDIIRLLKRKKICISLGHSMASFEEGIAAVKGGANLITHLFNAMLPFHHRDPGLVGLLSTEIGHTVFYGIIADGVHTHPSALRIAYGTHPKGAILVTDAISALGLTEGVHHLGEKTIQVQGDHAYIHNTTTLCGSIAPLSKCVRYFKKATGCSTVEALEAASLHPANALGIEDKKGTLNFGADADFIALDNNLNVISTYMGGKCVYDKIANHS